MHTCKDLCCVILTRRAGPGSLSAQRRRNERSLRNRVNDFMLAPKAEEKRRGWQKEYERRGILILDHMRRASPS